MTGETTIEISLIIAIIGCLLGVWSFFFNYRKGIQSNDDILNEIKTSVLKSNMKLDDQCGRIQDLQVDIKSTRNEIERMREIQIRLDMEIKALQKRLEHLEGNE